jgi:hypothetical protein
MASIESKLDWKVRRMTLFFFAPLALGGYVTGRGLGRYLHGARRAPGSAREATSGGGPKIKPGHTSGHKRCDRD